MSLVEIQIKDRTYYLKPLGPREGFKGLALLGKIMAPAIGAAAGAPNGSLGNWENALVENVAACENVVELFLPNLQYTSPNQTSPVPLKPVYANVMAGRFADVLLLAIQCVEATYGDFLDEKSDLRQYITAKMAQFRSTSVAE